jgi:hypothetical protein
MGASFTRSTLTARAGRTPSRAPATPNLHHRAPTSQRVSARRGTRGTLGGLVKCVQSTSSALAGSDCAPTIRLPPRVATTSSIGTFRSMLCPSAFPCVVLRFVFRFWRWSELVSSPFRECAACWVQYVPRGVLWARRGGVHILSKKFVLCGREHCADLPRQQVRLLSETLSPKPKTLHALMLRRCS